MVGYTRFDNSTLERVLTANLTKRQLKILLLILRFSSGCQKSYAVLRRNDFAYAGISPYCITGELQKLVKLRVIRWDSKRDLVWLNPRLQEWNVDRPGENPGENLRRFFKIASKNLLKWQVTSFQIGNPEVVKAARISGGIKEKKENINKNSIITRILTRYLQEVAPLSHEEASILREVLKSHSTRVVEDAITEAASGNSRTFAGFLKALDRAAEQRKPVRRSSGMESIGLALSRRSKRNPGL